MLTGDDERQIEDMMQACHALGQQLAGQGGEISWPDAETDSGIKYPSLIYDGPFSDGKTDRRVCFTERESVFTTAGAGSGSKVRGGHG